MVVSLFLRAGDHKEQNFQLTARTSVLRVMRVMNSNNNILSLSLSLSLSVQSN